MVITKKEQLISILIHDLLNRGINHDASKLNYNQASVFDKCIGRLHNAEYLIILTYFNEYYKNIYENFFIYKVKIYK